VASVAVHAALVAGFSHWPVRRPSAGAAPPGTTNFLCPSSDSPIEQSVLAPGDNAAAGPLGHGFPSAPIIVQVAAAELGPAVGASGVPGSPGLPGGQEGVADEPSGGAKAATSFFGVPALGQRIVYVLDRSGSMGLHRALETARRELETSLARLPKTASFQVIEYNSTAAALVGRVDQFLPATAENIRLATAALEALPASGTTKHLPALLMALGLRPDVIFFLTDADDLDDADRVQVTRINGGRSVIHTIELTLMNRGRPDMPMQRLARDNRGSYQPIDLFH
jgi:hypothetical protein